MFADSQVGPTESSPQSTRYSEYSRPLSNLNPNPNPWPSSLCEDSFGNLLEPRGGDSNAMQFPDLGCIDEFLVTDEPETFVPPPESPLDQTMNALYLSTPSPFPETASLPLTPAKPFPLQPLPVASPLLSNPPNGQAPPPSHYPHRMAMARLPSIPETTEEPIPMLSSPPSFYHPFHRHSISFMPTEYQQFLAGHIAMRRAAAQQPAFVASGVPDYGNTVATNGSALKTTKKHVRKGSLPSSLTGGGLPLSAIHRRRKSLHASREKAVVISATLDEVLANAATMAEDEHGETVFICPIPDCGKQFTRFYNLKSHQRTHTGEKPFVCDFEGCDAKFGRNHDLKRHQRVHTNTKPFQCSDCKKEFARQDALNRHLHITKELRDRHSAGEAVHLPTGCGQKPEEVCHSSGSGSEEVLLSGCVLPLAAPLGPPVGPKYGGLSNWGSKSNDGVKKIAGGLNNVGVHVVVGNQPMNGIAP